MDVLLSEDRKLSLKSSPPAETDLISDNLRWLTQSSRLKHNAEAHMPVMAELALTGLQEQLISF